MKAVKTGVIGCGAISDIYLTNMIGKYHVLEVVACSANHMESAIKKAEKYKIKACSTEDLLHDEEVELVVILTPAPSHYELIKKSLLAAKHVYVEKPIATDLEQAKELIDLAKAKGLRLGAAPETFMGSSFQTARKAIEDGLLGEITSFHVVANRDLTVLASLFKFLRQPGGGICYDYGVYYLTALVSLLGPIQEVFAKVGNHQKTRINNVPFSPEYQEEYIYDNEAQVNAILTTESGIAGTFSLNGDSAMQDQAYFTIQGTKGILQLGDANQFGCEIRFLPNNPEKCEWKILEQVSTLSDNCRGIGPSDMAYQIRKGGKHLASAEMACHVLDIVECIVQGRQPRTSCQKPQAFEHWREL